MNWLLEHVCTPKQGKLPRILTQHPTRGTQSTPLYPNCISDVLTHVILWSLILETRSWIRKGRQTKFLDKPLHMIYVLNLFIMGFFGEGRGCGGIPTSVSLLLWLFRKKIYTSYLPSLESNIRKKKFKSLIDVRKNYSKYMTFHQKHNSKITIFDKIQLCKTKKINNKIKLPQLFCCSCQLIS